MKKAAFFLALVFTLLLSCSAEASLYLSSGGKTFNINVVRRDYRPIYNARGNVFVSGNTARIEINAPGYRSAHRSIYLNDHTSNYNETVSLDDPTIFVSLQDDSYANIPNGTYSHYSQTFYQTDEFGIRGRFPVAGFEKVTSRDLDVRVNSMFAWLPRIYLTQRGEYWEFEIVIKRRDFSDFSNRIQILVKRTPAEAPASVEHIAAMADDYLHNLELVRTQSEEIYFDRLTSLAREINLFFPTLSAQDRDAILLQLKAAPQLTRELTATSNFIQIHH